MLTEVSFQHVIDRMIEAIEAVRMAVGSGIVMNYIFGGLFHPARKVRTAYWRVYNDAYVQGADGLIPYYPFGMDAEEGPKRSELYIVV